MKNTPVFSAGRWAWGVLPIMLLFGAAKADDIEIYLQPPPDPVYPNILFVLDESGSMRTEDVSVQIEQEVCGWVCTGFVFWGYCYGGDWVYQCTTQTTTTEISRLQALKNAMNELLDSGTIDNARIGIMGYTTNAEYSYYLDEDKLIDDNEVVPGSTRANIYWQPRFRSLYYGDATGFGVGKDVKAELKAAVNALDAYSWTPTMEAVAAGVEWFRVGFTETVHPRDNDLGGHANVTFDSPLDPKYYCASNHIVLLTDGRPNSNNGFDYWWENGRYKVFPKDPTLAQYPVLPNEPAPTTPNFAPYGGEACDTNDPENPYSGGSRGGLCAREVATWAFNADLRDSWAKQQRIFIHTIGFKTGTTQEKFLSVLASAGGGKFYAADNASQLLDAFTTIASEAAATISFTYTAPAIPFNADNAAVSGTDIYVPMLVPEAKRFWKGNVKRYRVVYNEATKKVEIKDKNGNDVLDSSFTFQDTLDYWNAGGSDGGETLVGGAISTMVGSRTRNLYTYLGDQNNVLLTGIDERVTANNTSITNAMLGAGSAAERLAILNWANWKDENGNAIKGDLGAPLHTKPLLVRYSGDQSNFSLVLMNSTDGMLHAFKSTTGEEHWAFMPDELLDLLKVQKDNVDGSLPIYGLDGPLTYYEISNKKYVVFGMRRGGRNLYALDITDRDKPKFAWEIKGGITAGFSNLAQTWSKPIFTRVKIEDASEQFVLIFGGGYDPDQDNVAPGTPDDMGNSIYIVNPTTGALIREIKSSDMVNGSMDNGIAANILPVDINANGVVDRLYAVDVGGRIIRVDIPDAELANVTGSNALTGTVLADVNIEGQTVDAEADFQRFFNTPEVAYYNRGGETYLALLVASGFRPDPLSSTTTDRFYMVKDPHVWAAPADGNDADSLPDYGDVIQESDLFDATDNIVQDGADGECTDAEVDSNPLNKRSCAVRQLRSAQGWYINFETGEKGFSEARVYDYAVFFTTYKLTGASGGGADVCKASSSQGDAALYVINMADGSAMVNVVDGSFDQDSTDALDVSDRKVGLNIPGMPPSPVLLFPESKVGNKVRLGGSVVAIVGLETVLQWPDRFHPISWEEVIGE